MRTKFLCLPALLVLGCSQQNAAKAGPATNSTKADKVSNINGKIAGDGKPDGAVSLTVDGPIIGLVVMTCSAEGTAQGGQQWDTYTVGQALPGAMKTPFANGDITWQLGVFENDKLLNAPDGTLAPVASGQHTLTLWLGDSGYFSKGNHFIVMAERPDHTIVKSNVFSF